MGYVRRPVWKTQLFYLLVMPKIPLHVEFIVLGLDLKVDPSGEQVGLFQMGLNVAESLTDYVLPENAKNSNVHQPEAEVQEKQEVQLTQPEVDIQQLTQFTSW